MPYETFKAQVLDYDAGKWTEVIAYPQVLPQQAVQQLCVHVKGYDIFITREQAKEFFNFKE